MHHAQMPEPVVPPGPPIPPPPFDDPDGPQPTPVELPPPDGEPDSEDDLPPPIRLDRNPSAGLPISRLRGRSVAARLGKA